MLKKVIIPVAAFAVTATSVSAFDLNSLRSSDINLTDSQIAAFEQVESLKDEGATREEIEAVLSGAGIDADLMRDVREEAQAAREAMRTTIDAALENNDYEAFAAAIEGSPMAEQVDSAEKFARLREAHQLMQEAQSIMDELGIEKKSDRGPGHRGPRDGQPETEE